MHIFSDEYLINSDVLCVLILYLIVAMMYEQRVLEFKTIDCSLPTYILQIYHLILNLTNVDIF